MVSGYHKRIEQEQPVEETQVVEETRVGWGVGRHGAMAALQVHPDPATSTCSPTWKPSEACSFGFLWRFQ